MKFLSILAASFFVSCFTVNASVQLIAHRGASAYAPENTISSIEKALEYQSAYIEIDVHMTSDGEVVAIHDSTIDRTSNGSGNVSDHTLAELKQMDFGSWFGDPFKGEEIPTLEEVLKAINRKAVLIIELKSGGDKYKDIEKKIVGKIKKMGLESHVILKSFSYAILNEFEDIAPEMKRLYCTFWGNAWLTIDNFLRFKGIFEGASFQYLQVHKYFLTDSIIKEAHERNIKVVVWDVHDKGSMEEFAKMGVDFIETDNPDFVHHL